jgi:hypothetical protein
MEKLNETLYFFEKSDGTSDMLSIEDAFKLDDPKIKARIETIIQNKKNKRMKKDGFTPGFQQNIMEYAGGPGEYAKKLKEKGLVEVGYDYIPQESTAIYNPFQNEEVLKELATMEELSGQEMDALKSGELLKDVTLDLGSED